MDIRQCKRCGKLFQFVSKPICQDCADEMDQMFIKVRDYIYNHPEASIDEISKEAEVEVDVIMDFLKDERLSIKPSEASILKCEHCGKPISKGRICDNCKESLGKALQGNISAAKPADKPAEQVDKYGRKVQRMHLNYKNKND